MSLHVQFGTLAVNLCHLEVWKSKWWRNFAISVGNVWSSKTQVDLETPFDLQGEGFAEFHREYYRRGWSHFLLPLEALVSPGDSKLVVWLHYYSKVPWDICMCIPWHQLGEVLLLIRPLSMCPELYVLVSYSLKVANTKWASKKCGDTQRQLWPWWVMSL